MTRASLACAWNAGAELGEGPLWDAAEQALYFVDIKGGMIHRCKADGGHQASWVAPGGPGFIMPAGEGKFICGIERSLYRFTPRDGAFALLRELERERPGNRINDAHVDAEGRLWFGTMDNAERASTGALYRLGADGTPLCQEDGFVISNGPATSPDGRTFYHTDTLEKTIHAYDVDAQGTLAAKRRFATIGQGYPDGSSVDAEGCVWVAIFGGARVERYAPSGELLLQVTLPCPNVTKIAFGGSDLRTAFVTTAWKGMTLAQRRREPLAGALFTFRAPAPGLPQPSITNGISP